MNNLRVAIISQLLLTLSYYGLLLELKQISAFLQDGAEVLQSFARHFS
jgi:hypothetical protein